MPNKYLQSLLVRLVAPPTLLEGQSTYCLAIFPAVGPRLVRLAAPQILYLLGQHPVGYPNLGEHELGVV